jgi:hypothetical protein
MAEEHASPSVAAKEDKMYEVSCGTAHGTITCIVPVHLDGQPDEHDEEARKREAIRQAKIVAASFSKALEREPDAPRS